MEKRDEQWLIARYQALTGEERGQYVLVSLKIKRFRIFSRIYGRAVGDELIEKVYEAISGWLWEGEYAAQIRLDYFNLLIRVPHEYHAIFDMIHSLNRAILNMPDERFHDKVFSGMGVYPLSKEPEDFYIAQYNADICRVECPERNFRNSHLEVYGMSYQDPNLRYFDLQQTIAPALEHGDFKLYLQPKVDLRTGMVAGAEALVRWIDPVRGNIPLGDFLPGLEENGLIQTVDLYLFDEVCRRINDWIRNWGKRVPISVNLSRSAFNYLYFFRDYKRIHQKYDTPRDCIEFELMESIVLNHAERVQQVVGELNGYGFSCALDDFGSGFSSYSVLTTAELAKIKLDRSLFQNHANVRERTVIRHIIQTAHELGMETVAEGVEDPAYVDFLRELGCEYLQGFVFYRPMPVEEFEARFIRGSECIALAQIGQGE